MKLLLTASGIKNPELEQAFLDLTDHRPNLKIAYISTAGDAIEWIPETEGGKKYIPKLKNLTPEEGARRDAWFREYIAKNKAKEHDAVIVDLKQDPAKTREILESVDVIEVGGGDIDYLLSWAKKSRLDTYLKDILEKDVVYVGTSAGSMLIQPDIGLTWWKPENDLDHVGLSIVNFLTSGSHGKESDDESVVNAVAKEKIERRDFMRSFMNYPWKIYITLDGQAVKVDGHKIEHIGPGMKVSV